MQFVEAHGVRIPMIGLGTMTLKGDVCVQAVKAALQMGYRHLDTAWFYGNEKEVGEGMRQSGVKREDILLCTKVRETHLEPDKFRQSLDESLANLQLPQVDLLLIHWNNKDIPFKTSIGALCKAKKDGFAKHVGIANFTTTMLDEAWAVTSRASGLQSDRGASVYQSGQGAGRQQEARHGVRIAMIGLGTMTLKGDVCVQAVKTALADGLPPSRYRLVLRQRKRDRRGHAPVRRQARGHLPLHQGARDASDAGQVPPVARREPCQSATALCRSPADPLEQQGHSVQDLGRRAVPGQERRLGQTCRRRQFHHHDAGRGLGGDQRAAGLQPDRGASVHQSGQGDGRQQEARHGDGRLCADRARQGAGRRGARTDRQGARQERGAGFACAIWCSSAAARSRAPRRRRI